MSSRSLSWAGGIKRASGSWLAPPATGHLHRFDGLPGCDSGPLVDEGAAFNGKGLSESGIAEVEVPAG